MLTLERLKDIPTDQLRTLHAMIGTTLATRGLVSDPLVLGTLSNSPPSRPKIGDFRVGQKVCFDHSTRGRIFITVNRINAKSLNGKTDEGMGWRVSPGLCRAA